MFDTDTLPSIGPLLFLPTTDHRDALVFFNQAPETRWNGMREAAVAALLSLSIDLRNAGWLTSGVSGPMRLTDLGLIALDRML